MILYRINGEQVSINSKIDIMDAINSAKYLKENPTISKVKENKVEPKIESKVEPKVESKPDARSHAVSGRKLKVEDI
jgi:hypothetical protein